MADFILNSRINIKDYEIMTASYFIKEKTSLIKIEAITVEQISKYRNSQDLPEYIMESLFDSLLLLQDIHNVPIVTLDFQFFQYCLSVKRKIHNPSSFYNQFIQANTRKQELKEVLCRKYFCKTIKTIFSNLKSNNITVCANAVLSQLKWVCFPEFHLTDSKYLQEIIENIQNQKKFNSKLNCIQYIAEEENQINTLQNLITFNQHFNIKISETNEINDIVQYIVLFILSLIMITEKSPNYVYLEIMRLISVIFQFDKFLYELLFIELMIAKKSNNLIYQAKIFNDLEKYNLPFRDLFPNLFKFLILEETNKSETPFIFPVITDIKAMKWLYRLIVILIELEKYDKALSLLYPFLNNSMNRWITGKEKIVTLILHVISKKKKKLDVENLSVRSRDYISIKSRTDLLTTEVLRKITNKYFHIFKINLQDSLIFTFNEDLKITIFEVANIKKYCLFDVLSVNKNHQIKQGSGYLVGGNFNIMRKKRTINDLIF